MIARSTQINGSDAITAEGSDVVVVCSRDGNHVVGAARGRHIPHHINIQRGIRGRPAIQDARFSQLVVVSAPNRIIGWVGLINAPGSIGGYYECTVSTSARVVYIPHDFGVFVRRNNIGF